MIELANRANIPEVDVIDSIIDGLNDKSSAIMILMSAHTIAELKEALKRYEKKRRVPVVVKTNNLVGMTVRRSNTGAVAKPKHAQMTAAASTAVSAVGGVDLSTIRCFNCFKYGHYQSQCTEAKRPFNSCFVCGETGHMRHDCPKKKKKEELVGHVEDWNDEVDDDDTGTTEVKTLAKQLAESHMVSVGFINRNKCMDFIKCIGLFDTGSPVSFVRRSMVPFEVNRVSTVSTYRSVGGKRLCTYGTVKCKFVYARHRLIHYFIILPDEQMLLPMLVGRDLLRKMRIHLCQLMERKYNKTELLSLNKNKENLLRALPLNISRALNSFNLNRCPDLVDKSCSTTDYFKKTMATKCEVADNKISSDHYITTLAFFL